VLEHLEDPNLASKKCVFSLKPDGIIYIAVPDIESAASRIFRRKLVGYQKAPPLLF